MGTATDITTASRTSPEVREEQDVAWGVAVNALGVRSSSIVTGDPTDARVPPCDSMLPRECVPPLVLLPSAAGEPLRIDATSPRHPRCAGDVWPPDQRMTDKPGSEGEASRRASDPEGSTDSTDWVPLVLAWADFVSRAPLAGLSDEQRVRQQFSQHEGQLRREVQVARAMIAPHSSAEIIATSIAAAIGYGTLPEDRDRDRRDEHHTLNERDVEDATSRHPVVVVPNTLPMSRQQSLIEECRRLNVEARLVWRPVAAALAWCEEFESIVLDATVMPADSSGVMPTDGSLSKVGSVLCLHLGMIEFELTRVELVARPCAQRRYLVPARRRPQADRDVLPSFGLDLLAAGGSGHAAPQTVGARTDWNALWSEGQVLERLRQLSEARTESSASVVELLTGDFGQDCWRAGLHESRGDGQSNRSQPGTSGSIAGPGQGGSSGAILRSFFEWLDAIRDDVLSAGGGSTDGAEIVGLVVTGELARAMYDETSTVWASVLERLRVSKRALHLLVDHPLVGVAGGSGPSLAARGAALVAQRLANNESPWLDTLPTLRTATYQNGRPDWLDLLQSDDEFVEGGRVWKRPQPVRGLKVQSGRHSLEVPVWHEEFPTVRTVAAEFDRVLDADIDVELEVQISPAQGNARIEVRPVRAAEVHATGPRMGGQRVGNPRVGEAGIGGALSTGSLRPLWLEWSRMSDSGKSPADWLKDLPTSFPPPMLRSASRGKWRTVRSAMQTLLRSGSKSQITSVTSLLQQRDTPDAPAALDGNMEARATAVASDGTVPDDATGSEILNDYVEQLLEWLPQTKGQTHSDVLRGLAYTSTDHPGFQQWLVDCVRASGHALNQQQLAACGWCLRDPHAIASLAEHLSDRLQRDRSGHNVWLKALAEILRYRDDACREISTPVCDRIVAGLCDVFEGELTKRNTQVLFRNSSLCIVYLLRRREYDDTFLAKEQPLTTRVRSLFQEAITTIRAGRTRTIGGSINLDRALQTMIDYVDRKGPALLSASGFQELADQAL
jgi:hypothetical protein